MNSLIVSYKWQYKFLKRHTQVLYAWILMRYVGIFVRVGISGNMEIILNLFLSCIYYCVTACLNCSEWRTNITDNSLFFFKQFLLYYIRAKSHYGCKNHLCNYQNQMEFLKKAIVYSKAHFLVSRYARISSKEIRLVKFKSKCKFKSTMQPCCTAINISR